MRRGGQPDAPGVFVVGAGRAGRSLAVALDAAGVPVLGLAGRERPFPTVIGGADVVLVATPDAVIDDVLVELRASAQTTSGPGPHAVIVQLSGARAPGAVDDALRSRVAGVGTFHPLVPLADPALGADRLRGAWVGIGGDDAAVAMGRLLAGRIGAHALVVPDDADGRARYHAAAVFASNFPVVLAAVAERLFVASGVDAGPARGAVVHLLSAAASNVAGAARAADALTGPVARGDVETAARHLGSLAGDADADAVYRALSRAAIDVARTTGRLDAASARALAALLEQPS